MKRIAYSLLLILTLCPACGFAQGRVMYGVTAGINSRSLYESDINGAFHMADRLIYPLLGIEIGYYDWDRFSFTAQILLDASIEIPLLLKIPILRSAWKAYIFAGPTVGFSLDPSGFIDYGIYGGIGISHSLSKNVDLFFQTGYAFGLSNIGYPIPGVDYIFLAKEYSRIFRIYFGILFGNKK